VHEPLQNTWLDGSAGGVYFVVLEPLLRKCEGELIDQAGNGNLDPAIIGQLLSGALPHKRLALQTLRAVDDVALARR